MQREHDARGGRDALAAGKMVIERIKVADEHRDCSDRHDPVGRADNGRERTHGEDHNESFDTVADERQQRSNPVAGAEHVRRAGIVRPVLVGIRQSECLADDDGERDRPDQVRGDDDQRGGEHESVQSGRVESVGILEQIA